MKKGVLFVCIGNSCRSTMAEALTKYHWHDMVDAFSVGTSPLGHITPYTLQALSERNIPTADLESKGFADIPFEKIHLVVALTRAPFEYLLPSSFSGKIIHWHVPDPFGQGLSAFREARYTIELMVRRKLPEWLGLDTTRPDPHTPDGSRESQTR